MKNYNKLDTMAKLYPSVASKNNTSVFRISIVLKEKIDKNALQLAVNMIYERYHLYFKRLKNGIFWNYFDNNYLHFKVEEEKACPCTSILAGENNGYVLKVLYFNNRISVEAFHSITDGSGVVEFLKSLTYYYLVIKHGNIEHENKILLYDEIAKSNFDDSFIKYFSRFTKEDKQYLRKSKFAFKFNGKKYKKRGNSVVVGIADVSAIKTYCKNSNCTITAFLSALLIESIYEIKQKGTDNTRPIVIALPVNLRKQFESDSLKNFFGLTHLTYYVNENTKFEDIVAEMTKQISLNTSAENLKAISRETVRRSSNVFSKHTPLVLKNLFLPYVYSVMGEQKKTIPFSNLGNISMPEGTKKYIEHAEFLVYPTSITHLSIGVCSFDNKLSLNFTRTYTDASIIRYFFTKLQEKTDSIVNVYSNMWGDSNE